jgi:hypothetical protein
VAPGAAGSTTGVLLGSWMFPLLGQAV